MVDPQQMRDSTGKPIERIPKAVRAGTNAIIFNCRGEILLELRSDNGFWGLPGGEVEVGESVEQSVKREVFEETGLTISIKRLVGIYSDPMDNNISSYPDGNIIQYVTAAFECVQQGGSLTLSSESLALNFFDPKALPKKCLVPHVRRVQDAIKFHETPFLR